jgi:hypothetical protein
MTISNCTSSKSEAELRSLAWWCMPVIPAFRRLRQEDDEFKASLGYIGTQIYDFKIFITSLTFKV